MQSPGTYQTGAVWCSLQKERQKEWAEERASVGREENEEELEQSCACPKDALEPLAGPFDACCPLTHLSSSRALPDCFSPGKGRVCPGMDTPHAPGSPSCRPGGLHAPNPSWLLTCRCCALLGPGAAPSRPGGRPGPAVHWTCCCRCWWGRVWRKATGTESRSHTAALHPGTNDGCSISVSSPSQEHPAHRPPAAALTLLGCLVRGQAGCPQLGAPSECQETPAVAGHRHWDPGRHPGIATHAGPRPSSSALCVPLGAALPHRPPA